ncbi:tetratricopeptide repeat protein, partial [Planktomarina temperata]|nr:tetratricopeptide repeat protein [Planktomarina temperata]
IALKQAQFLIQKFPNSLFLNNICGVIYESLGELNASLEAYNKALVIKPDYADAHYNSGNVLKAQGRLAEAIKAYKKTLAIKPNYADAYLNMGNALKDQGKSDMAIDAFNKALAIKPDYALAHNNKGNIFNDQGKHLEAVESYNKAIAIAPDYFEAHLNMGNALREHGKLLESVESYKRAQAIKPDFAEAWLNMGVALKDQGQLEEAIEAFEEAIATKSDYAEAKHNLTDLLKKYSSQYLQKSKIITLDTKIKKKHREKILPKKDSELANHTLELLSELQATDKNLRTEYLQIYRTNKIDLNCKRHQAVFREKKIIPNFCFGCYKVQVDVTTVLDLIRLAALFYESEFESDLTRKCLVEVRPNIPGSYKGLIYCRGIDQAHSVKTQLDVQVRDIDKNLVAKIKRGCSEFPLTFPRYGEIGASERDMMQYPQEWQPLETEFDEKNLITPQTFVMSSLKEFCLSDYLIIQKWIDYSKGIGDPTSKLFCDLPVRYEEIFKIAKARVQS